MGTVDQLAQSLGAEVLRLFFLPSSRMFLPFLIAGLIIALVVMVRENSKKLADHERLLSRATWLSRSAINDYGLILANTLLFSTLLAPLLFDSSALTGWFATHVPNFGAAPSWWLPYALALALFVADDFARYIGHYLEHRVPALWELHKVHHSAEALNFVTAERHHPLALIWFRLIDGLVLALVNGLFIAFFAEGLTVVALMGGNLFWVLTNMLGGVLRHSPVWLSFGPRIERWFISPAQHQIHHSIDPLHFDRNFGGTLAIWDRMFGTLYTTTPAREHISYGLGEETRQYHSLVSLYVVPVKKLIRRFVPSQDRKAAV